MTGKLDTARKVIELGRNARDVANTASDLRNAANDFRQADKGEMGRQAGRQAFNHGAETGKEVGKTWLKTFEVMPRLICRGLQFLFALIACGFYGNRVASDDSKDHGFSPEWIFALFIAGVSAFTAVLFVIAAPLSALPVVGSRLKISKTYRAFPWDLGLFICWIVVFGIFAGIFLGRDSDKPYKGSSTTAMKTAVWVDLVNVILWLVSGSYGAIKTFLGDKVNSLTDKAGTKLFTKKDKTANKEMEMDNYSQQV